MGRWPIIRTDRLIDRYFDEIYVSAYSPVYLFHVHDKILILDFGSQYTQLIARRVRALHIYAEIHRYDLSDAFIRNIAPRGIILSGGPASVAGANPPRAPQAVFELGVPVLGICYGMQTMAAQLGGKVKYGQSGEFGHTHVHIHEGAHWLGGLAEKQSDADRQTLAVWMSHGDLVTGLPPGFECIASTENCPITAMAHHARRFYGVQFHPEVTHTAQGNTLLARFALDICGARADWVMDDYLNQAIERIRQQVGDERVILGLSGGVDSSVAEALLQRAIGEQRTCVFVDHGLLRLNEAAHVRHAMAALGVKIEYVDASAEFIARLAGVTDPEQKRQIIGAQFIEVFQREARACGEAQWLAQGTIYSDVIESAGSGGCGTAKIKSHHNVGGLPQTLRLKLLEPLRELFKDEVRELGIALGLPPEMVFRHPFPGPGLAVRIPGEVKPEYIDRLQRADAIFIDCLRNAVDPATGRPWYAQMSQAFAVFLPVKSVGVMGDARTYEYVIALRAVQTQDFMTAHWAHLPHELLGQVSSRIINEVRGINRVVYDISGKPPATIEWE